jgi:hypothetical protein
MRQEIISCLTILLHRGGAFRMNAEELLPVGLLDPSDPEYEDPGGEAGARKPEHIVLVVYAPKDPHAKRFRFPLADTVGAAAQVAAEAFGYAAGNPSFQVKEDPVLDRSLTLEQAGLHNHEHVELVDAGGGV